MSMPFKYYWRAFWYGFFHPFNTEEGRHAYAVKLADELAAEREAAQ